MALFPGLVLQAQLVLSQPNNRNHPDPTVLVCGQIIEEMHDKSKPGDGLYYSGPHNQNHPAPTVSVNARKLVEQMQDTYQSGDGLYHNGPLGRCFAPKTLETQERERILQRIRENHYQEQLQDLCGKKIALEEKYSRIIHKNSGVRGIYAKHSSNDSDEEIQALRKYQDIEYQIKILIENKHQPTAITLNPVISHINQSTAIKLNPVIPHIRSQAKELTSIKFRSALHHLRQKFHKEHMKHGGCEALPFSKDEISEFLQAFLRTHPNGVTVQYTDGHIVTINYDTSKNDFMYWIRKPIR